MEILGDGADAIQRPAQHGREVGQALLASRDGALEGTVMHPRQDPGLVWNARSIWAQRNVVATRLHHTDALPLFLGDDVAKYATLFLGVILATRAQLIQHAAWHER